MKNVIEKMVYAHICCKILLKYGNSVMWRDSLQNSHKIMFLRTEKLFIERKCLLVSRHVPSQFFNVFVERNSTKVITDCSVFKLHFYYFIILPCTSLYFTVFPCIYKAINKKLWILTFTVIFKLSCLRGFQWGRLWAPQILFQSITS